MFMRIQKWNLEVELNSAKLKKVKIGHALLKFGFETRTTKRK